MGLRFRRSVRIAPGIKINLTKTGLGMTVGPRGNHYSVHSSGRRTRTIGLPDTGLYYQSISGSGHRPTSRPRSQARSPAPDRLVPVDPRAVIPQPGLFASAAEKAYHAGVLAYLGADQRASLAAFEQVLAHDPSVTSAQRRMVWPLRNSRTPRSTASGRLFATTTVATIASQRSLKATARADRPRSESR